MRLSPARFSIVTYLTASILVVSACGVGSPTMVTQGQTTTPICHIQTADLRFGAGGTPVAQHVTVSGPKTLRIAGSTALAPLFQEAQSTFDQTNGTNTQVLPTSSSDGLQQVVAGTADIGMSDIFASEKHITGLIDDEVAAVVFTLVVSPDLAGKVNNLSTKQVGAIYAGTITNWAQIPGGPNEPITVVGRTAGSGTRATFARYVLQQAGVQDDATKSALVVGTTQDLVNAIATHSGAIGYTATNFVLYQQQAAKVMPICIDGVGATVADVAAGTYHFWSFEHAYTQAAASAAAQHMLQQTFLAYIDSSGFQTLALPRYDFLQVGQIPAAIAATHQLVP